MVSIDCSDTV